MSSTPTTARFQVRYTVLGEICYNNFVYFSDTVTAPGQADDILNAWWADVEDTWADLLAVEARVLQVSLALYHFPAIGYVESASIYPNLDGLVAGGCLAPYWTLTLAKVPDNSTIDPVGATPFSKPGRIPLSGIPESGFSNGSITPGYNVPVNAFAIAHMGFTATLAEGAVDFDLGMQRLATPSTPVSVDARVDSIYLMRFGTQNTRKS